MEDEFEGKRAVQSLEWVRRTAASGWRRPATWFPTGRGDTAAAAPGPARELGENLSGRRYVAPVRSATCRKRPCPGNAELSWTDTRRTLTVTLAATFKSRSRIVPTVARARSLPRR